MIQYIKFYFIFKKKMYLFLEGSMKKIDFEGLWLALWALLCPPGLENVAVARMACS